MANDIYNKLHAALYAITPLADERDRLISQMGETIWLESLEKMVGILPDTARAEAVGAINANDLEKAIEIFESNSINVESVLSETATSILDELLGSEK